MLQTLLEVMKAQEESYKNDPNSFVKPSWELAKDIIEHTEEKRK